LRHQLDILTKEASLPETTRHDLEGIWLSEYEYPSQDPQPATYPARHYVAFNQVGGDVTGTSIPHSEGSELKLNLQIHEDNIIIGTWMEKTSKGLLYHGSINLIIEPSGTRLQGKWLGFDRRRNINAGPWEFTFQERDMSAKARQKYEIL
jgi:hypothetical protein